MLDKIPNVIRISVYMHICDCHPKTGWLVDFYFILYSILFRICNYIPILYTPIFSSNFTCHIPYYFLPLNPTSHASIGCQLYQFYPTHYMVIYTIYICTMMIYNIYLHSTLCYILSDYSPLWIKFIPISIPLFLEFDHGTILQEELYIYLEINTIQKKPWFSSRFSRIWR